MFSDFLTVAVSMKIFNIFLNVRIDRIDAFFIITDVIT
jgi:hypothetical protein